MSIYNISGVRAEPYSLSGLLANAAFDISGGQTYPDGTVAFEADFSGSHPLSSQFYTWEGRTIDIAVIDALANIECQDGVVDLKSYYNAGESKWFRQLLSTGGIFEADDFELSFKAIFCPVAGSWNNVITYGTGLHWEEALYSKGIKWPAGGEIDAFEQVGGYSANPNFFHPAVHFGAGTESEYPDKHQFESIGGSNVLPVGEWADYMFSLHEGIISIYLNDALLAQKDISDISVNNNYLWNYKPFTKPQAFYIDGKFAEGSQSKDTTTVYHFYVKDFEVKVPTNQIVSCSALEIYPQMWEPGTNLVFPTNAEIYLDRKYTPSNVSNKACTWQSSNTSVATVVQGYVKTLAEGTCTITATCGEATASYALTVSNANANIPCAGIAIGTGTIELIEGREVDLSGFIYKYPRFTTDNISLTSSDPSVAAVNGTKITAIGLGNATITVICGTKSLSIPVKVSDGIIFEDDIELTASAQTIYNDSVEYDQTATYSFKYTFGSHTPASQSSSANTTVGPYASNNSLRNGGILFIGAAQAWKYLKGGSEETFTPTDGDVLTIVYNFSSEKMNVYLNSTQLITNASVGKAYFVNAVKIAAGADNANMLVAPVHVKIAIGDLH